MAEQSPETTHKQDCSSVAELLAKVVDFERNGVRFQLAAGEGAPPETYVARPAAGLIVVSPGDRVDDVVTILARRLPAYEPPPYRSIGQTYHVQLRQRTEGLGLKRKVTARSANGVVSALGQPNRAIAMNWHVVSASDMFRRLQEVEPLPFMTIPYRTAIHFDFGPELGLPPLPPRLALRTPQLAITVLFPGTGPPRIIGAGSVPAIPCGPWKSCTVTDPPPPGVTHVLTDKGAVAISDEWPAMCIMCYGASIGPTYLHLSHPRTRYGSLVCHLCAGWLANHKTKNVLYRCGSMTAADVCRQMSIPPDTPLTFDSEQTGAGVFVGSKLCALVCPDRDDFIPELYRAEVRQSHAAGSFIVPATTIFTMFEK